MITISLIEYRLILVFLIIGPPIVFVAMIEAGLWMTRAFARLKKPPETYDEWCYRVNKWVRK